MLEIGQLNHLEILERTPRGLFLDGGDDGEIYLPLQEAPPYADAGGTLEVFVYFNSEDLLVATTQIPHAMVGEFAQLEVTSMQSIGAFLDWGLPKDLFLPFREQTRELNVGSRVIVFLYLDSSHRISASMRTDKYVDHSPGNYREGQGVDLFITGHTELGYKAIINGRHGGILYQNEVFETLKPGQHLPGFIKKLRADGKIDLSLQQAGFKAAEDVGERILERLETEGGFLPVGDKSSAEEIYDLFGISKKKYKMAVGNLFRRGALTIENDGLRLKF